MSNQDSDQGMVFIRGLGMVPTSVIIDLIGNRIKRDPYVEASEVQFKERGVGSYFDKGILDIIKPLDNIEPLDRIKPLDNKLIGRDKKFDLQSEPAAGVRFESHPIGKWLLEKPQDNSELRNIISENMSPRDSVISDSKFFGKARNPLGLELTAKNVFGFEAEPERVTVDRFNGLLQYMGVPVVDGRYNSKTGSIQLDRAGENTVQLGTPTQFGEKRYVVVQLKD